MTTNSDLVDTGDHIIELLKATDKIQYLGEEDYNKVSNLKKIVISARKILESKQIKYRILRTAGRIISPLAGIKVPKKRVKINQLTKKKITNSLMNKHLLQNSDLEYIMKHIQKRHLSRENFLLFNMNLVSLTPEINSIIKYIANNFLDLFLGLLDVIIIDTSNLNIMDKDPSLYNGKFTQLGKKIKNNPNLLYNFETLEQILSLLLNLICPYNTDEEYNEDNFPNVLEAIFSEIIIANQNIINEKLRGLSDEEYSKLDTKLLKNEITIFKLISEKINNSFDEISKILSTDNQKILFNNNSTRRLQELLNLLDNGEKIPIYILISYYIKSIIEQDQIQNIVRFMYLEYITDMNIAIFNKHNQELLTKISLIHTKSGGGKRTKKRGGGIFTTYKIRHQELFNKIKNESKLPYQIKEGLSKGLNTKYVDEFIELQTNNNNLMNLFYKKNESTENYKYNHLRLLIGYTGIVANDDNKKILNDFVSKYFIIQSAKIFKKSANEFSKLVSQSLRKYYYSLTFQKTKLNIKNYREGMLSKYGLFRILSFLISLSYASFDDKLLSTIFNPKIIQVLKIRKKIAKKGILQVDTYTNNLNIVGKSTLFHDDIYKSIDYGMDCLIKILDRFLYSKHIKLLGHTFKRDINRIEAAKIRNILVFFLVYMNLNNLMDTIMKDNNNAENIYKLMHYTVELSNTNKIIISDNDKKDFNITKQLLFDKIACCFMFEKLFSFYDNFKLINLLNVLRKNMNNDKNKLFNDKELKLFSILFQDSDISNNYFDKILDKYHISYENKFNKDIEPINHRFLNLINYCLNYSFVASFPLFEEILEYQINRDHLFICHETHEYLNFDLTQPKISDRYGKNITKDRDDSIFFLKV